MEVKGDIKNTVITKFYYSSFFDCKYRPKKT